MSDTPRTDAVSRGGSIYSFGKRITELSRQLERELATAIKQRDKAIGKRRTPSIYSSKWECGK